MSFSEVPREIVDQIPAQAIRYATNPRPRILGWFSRLTPDSFEIIGHSTQEYNCIAWAAGDTTAWWWPVPPHVAFWPDGVPNELAVETFVRAFATLGYGPCATAHFDRRLEKVALSVKGGKPSHAARQLPDGRWSSKLGPWECITHELDALEGDGSGVDGQVVCLLSRRRPTCIARILGRLTEAARRYGKRLTAKAHAASHRAPAGSRARPLPQPLRPASPPPPFVPELLASAAPGDEFRSCLIDVIDELTDRSASGIGPHTPPFSWVTFSWGLWGVWWSMGSMSGRSGGRRSVGLHALHETPARRSCKTCKTCNA